MPWHRRFFWVLLVLLPTQLGYHFWPEWAMVLGRRVDYLSPTVYLSDILLFATVVIWFYESPFRIMKYELGIMERTKKLISFIIRNSRFIILMLAVVVNIFIAHNRYVAVYKWLKAVEFIALGWYIVKTKPRLAAIITPLSIGVLYSSIIAITQFVLQHSIGGPLWWLGERTFDAGTPGIARIDWYGREFLRPYATFPHPNVLGGYIAALLPLVIIQLSNNPIIKLSNTKKTLFLVVFILGAVALLLTFSRSAIVVGGIAIAVAIARIKKINRNVVTVLIGFIVLLPTSYFILHNSTEESVVVRQQLNAAAIKLWQSSPLFGVGLGNFLVRLPEALPSRTIYFLQPVHNIYLLLLSEIGIVGIGLIVFCIATLLNYESRIMKYGKDKTKFIIRTSLFIILVLGLLDHYPLTLQQGQLLLTVLAGMSIAFVH